MAKKIIGGALMLALIASGSFLWWKLKQVDAGICARTGSVLTDDELRHAVIDDLINIRLQNIRHQNIEYNHGGMGMLVTEPVPDDEIAEAVASAASGNQLPEILKKYLRNVDGPETELTKEPMTILFYDLVSGVWLERIDSRDIKRVGSGATKCRPNIFEKMRGFGRSYYAIETRQFRYSNHLTDDDVSSPTRESFGVHHIGVDNIGVARNSGVISRLDSDVSDVVFVSNCGNIMTRKSDRGFRDMDIKGRTKL